MASSSRHKLDDSSNTCQRCRQPLLLDPSLTDFSLSTHSLITSALPAPSPSSTLPPASKLAQLPPLSRASARIWADAQESFILLSDSALVPPPGPSRQGSTSSGSTPIPSSPALAANLHALLSSRTPIDHPLCTECTVLLQSELQKQLEELSRERDAYIAFERGVLRNREELTAGRQWGDALGEDDIEGTPEEWQELIRRKKELEIEEDRLRKVLEEKERELEGVRVEEARVKREEEEVEREEEEFLLSHALLQTSQNHLRAALHTAQTHLLVSQSLLAHLESANVYNDAFQIGHVPLHPNDKGSITVGTINGLRLGGRPVVEWDEINAGWGLVGLCIDRVGVKVECTFEGYKIVPLGSFSRIEELPPGKGVYELYASSDLSPARILQNRRFNTALVGLLDMLRQLVEHGRRTDRGWGVGNVEIHKDRISNYSIRLPGISAMQMPALPSMSIVGLASSIPKPEGDCKKDRDRDAEGTGDEQWTRACRAVLTVLKRVLVVESEAERAVVGAAAPG